MLTWELVGAVVGAGLASGQEIASFFSRYGSWSWCGIVLAVITLLVLGSTKMPVSWEKRWPSMIWHGLLRLMLIATGGAMLAGAGELASLTLPIRNAKPIGITGTLLLAWMLANRSNNGLAGISRILLCVLALLLTLGLTMPPIKVARIDQYSFPAALIRGITYGGFNAALQVPMISQASTVSMEKKRRAILGAGMLVLCILLLGNCLLLRHRGLLGEAMPFIRMLMHYGKLGYWLGAVCLFLAILSTLTACMRGLGRRLVYTAGIVISAMLGFAGVVEVLYSFLGGSCGLMLAAAKFTNHVQDSFISQRDML